MDRLLVTGGLGFIGSNFIRFVLEKRNFAAVVNVDSISYGAVRQNLSDLAHLEGYHFVKGDIADKRLVAKFMQTADVVINFAAETHVDRSISNPGSFLGSNVHGTFTLLETARRSNITKFIHISTDEVYGSASSNSTFKETDRLQTSSPYSASKAAADMFVESYHKTYGLPTVTLRCTNNFGPRQFPEKFIPKAIISALLRRKIPLYGDGMQVRDWVYVLDFCRAIELAIQKGETGTVYNVSAGNELPNLEIARRVLKILRKPPDLIQFVEDRPGHDFRYSLDSTRIRDRLGWQPEHNFSEALEETVAWYVNHESWWKPLLSRKILSPTPWKEKW